MTYGTDSIISGATTMDLGSKRGAATAAGFINGVGSTGQPISPMIIAYVYWCLKYGCLADLANI